MIKWLKKCYLGLVLVFLYVPIIVLIVQSFNAGKSRAKWEGFSFRWYIELFRTSARCRHSSSPCPSRCWP